MDDSLFGLLIRFNNELAYLQKYNGVCIDPRIIQANKDMMVLVDEHTSVIKAMNGKNDSYP